MRRGTDSEVGSRYPSAALPERVLCSAYVHPVSRCPMGKTCNSQLVVRISSQAIFTSVSFTNSGNREGRSILGPRKSPDENAKSSSWRLMVNRPSESLTSWGSAKVPPIFTLPRSSANSKLVRDRKRSRRLCKRDLYGNHWKRLGRENETGHA